MVTFDPGRYPAALAHDPIREMAPDVFFVGGTMQMGRMMRISRNMVIVRTGSELVLVNPVRLSPSAEAELESLGNVKHVIRLGVFHGYDDAYSVARFEAQFWCQAGSTHYPAPAPDQTLTETGPVPVADGELFVFREISRPECALLIRRGNGLLLVCDSLQHYGDFSRQSVPAKIMMPFIGFRRGMQVGPMWLKFMTPKGSSIRPDFDRLLELEFDSLVSAHGTPLMHGAKAAVRDAVERARFKSKK